MWHFSYKSQSFFFVVYIIKILLPFIVYQSPLYMMTEVWVMYLFYINPLELDDKITALRDKSEQLALE